ncbi:hypothetical protein DSM25558_2865 [Agrobacterium sp. DSM 25558]|nr:hypothetical protein DSM25558_2865 [Agrobacterium sp. DSM 25558]
MAISGLGPCEKGNLGIIASDNPSIITHPQRKPIS